MWFSHNFQPKWNLPCKNGNSNSNPFILVKIPASVWKIMENHGKHYSNHYITRSKQSKSRLENVQNPFHHRDVMFTVPKSKLSQKMTLRVLLRNLNCTTWWHLVLSLWRCLNRFFRRTAEKRIQSATAKLTSAFSVYNFFEMLVNSEWWLFRNYGKLLHLPQFNRK